MTLFAQFGLSEAALGVVRVIAAVGGAFVGWLLSDPFARITYRIAVHRPIPGWSLPWVKLLSSVAVGLLVYFFIPLGGGPGGWGYGPGPGGAPGQGAGAGGKETGTVTQGARPDDVKTPADKKQSAPTAIVRRPVEIEVLGGKRYPGEERYYLVRSMGKALTLGEVESYFKEHGAHLELHVVLTDESPDEITGITAALTRLADRYHIPSLIETAKRCQEPFRGSWAALPPIPRPRKGS